MPHSSFAGMLSAFPLRPSRLLTTGSFPPNGCGSGAEIYQFHGTSGPDMVSFSGSKWLSMLFACRDLGFPIYQKGERDEEF